MLFSAPLIQREAAPLLQIEEEVAVIESSRAAIRCYIQAGIRYQMRRPLLARLIDIAEKTDTFSDQLMGTVGRLQAVVETILGLPDAPKVWDRTVAAADVVTLTRSLIDAAGERREDDSNCLLRRVEGAIWGYLSSG